MGAIRLIVNADDFGFTHDVNAGIVEAHRDGILTAATLMANGNAFDDALALARENPSLDIGCHVVLVQGKSVLEPGRALPATVQELLMAIARREIRIYEEIAAQVRRIMCAGVRPSHIDTHKHTHLLPPVLHAVTRVARDFGIPWVRRPFDFGVDRRAKVLKAAVAVGMRALAPGFASSLKELRTTDHFTGFQLTGALDARSLLETLSVLPEGLTEFMCHPGRLGVELSEAQTRLKESREIELKALLSPEARELINRRGIELTNYRNQK